jgi:hypothetical protein
MIRREYITIAFIVLIIVVFNIFYSSLGNTTTEKFETKAATKSSETKAATKSSEATATTTKSTETKAATKSSDATLKTERDLKYDSNNYNLTYHDEVAENGIRADISLSQISKGSFFSNNTGNYVPNYENTIYLSKTTGKSTVFSLTPSTTFGENPHGFCSSELPTIEENCNKLPMGICASTKCCVLLGDGKCVAGNEKGPTLEKNSNRDFYYYSGKCYGDDCKTNSDYIVSTSSTSTGKLSSSAAAAAAADKGQAAKKLPPAGR